MKSSTNKNKYFLDSECSKNMIGDKIKFIALTSKNREHVTIWDNSRENIMEIGKINIEFSSIIEDVLLVESLKYNLLNTS